MISSRKYSRPKRLTGDIIVRVFLSKAVNGLINTVTQIDTRIAKQILEKFIHEVEHLYGRGFFKFNVHLLLHIPESVKQFGSLWAQSKRFPLNTTTVFSLKLFYLKMYVSHFKILLKI